MIQISNFSFSFKKKNVFKNLNLEIGNGQVCGILGKNGNGKTTLLHNIAGLLFPTKGEIFVQDFVPQKRQPDFLQNIFLVPEEFYLPKVSIENYLKTLSPFYPKFDKKSFDDYLHSFDIPTLHNLDEMSYGQKKKVLISFALASGASVVLLDEPTNGLDIQSKSQLKKVIAGITDEEKIILISTHQVKDLENLIDRIIIIDNQNVVFDETLENIGKKLHFKFSFDKDEISQAIFTEESIKGSAIVLPNNGTDESKIDLEMLYKTVVFAPETIEKIFSSSNKSFQK